MFSEDMAKIDLFIGQFIEGEQQELPVGVSFAGNYYQKKVRSILSIAHSISIIYGDKNQIVESKKEIEYIFLSQRRHVFNILTIIRSILKLFIKKNRQGTVLFYNLSIYSLFLYIYFVFFSKARVVV